MFEPPTARSQADFETKTAAIHVTPTPNEKYDIAAVKRDAAWLSKCANINEVTALRIVVVELQSRPQSHLAGPLSGQDVANIREAAGSADVLAAIDPTSIPDAEEFWKEFERASSKRRRLLATYLSERRYFMMSADCFTSFMLHGKGPSPAPDAVDTLRQDVLAAYGLRTDPDRAAANLLALLSAYLEMLPTCIQRSQTAIDSVFKDADSLSDQLQFEWARTALVEAVHCMTVIFQILDISSDRFASASVAARWFEIMRDCNFLDQLCYVSLCSFLPARCVSEALTTRSRTTRFCPNWRCR